MGNEPKQTSLYPFHVANEAKTGNFGGYEMPLWYPSGPKKEHLAVIQQAGMFDTSHMAVLVLTGVDALSLLQHCFSKDLNACIGPAKAPLQIGKCVYGVFLNPQGHVIDDSLVYQIAEDHYALVVNAGMGAIIASHLAEQKGSWSVIIEDLTDTLGKIDVQGPAAAKIIRKVLKNPELVLEKLPYFNFKGYFESSAVPVCEVTLLNGTPILLSRTGYTGEFGFEIFVAGAETQTLWDLLNDAGQEYEMLCCGLAARDSLRAGAVLPLSHQDIGSWPFVNHPWPFSLPYKEDNSGFLKAFIGAEALLSQQDSDYTYAFAGFDPRKVVPGPDTLVVDESDETLGSVLTCATDMAIDRWEGQIVSIVSDDCPKDLKFRGLSCGFLKSKKQLAAGDIVYLTGNKRRFQVEIRADIRPARTARKAMKKML